MFIVSKINLFIVFITTYICALTLAVKIEPDCPQPNGPDSIYFPHENCSKFWQCSNGIPYLFNCPADLHFNTEINICDRPNNSGCIASSTISSTSKLSTFTNTKPSSQETTLIIITTKQTTTFSNKTITIPFVTTRLTLKTTETKTSSEIISTTFGPTSTNSGPVSTSVVKTIKPSSCTTDLPKSTSLPTFSTTVTSTEVSLPKNTSATKPTIVTTKQSTRSPETSTTSTITLIPITSTTTIQTTVPPVQTTTGPTTIGLTTVSSGPSSTSELKTTKKNTTTADNSTSSTPVTLTPTNVMSTTMKPSSCPTKVTKSTSSPIFSTTATSTRVSSPKSTSTMQTIKTTLLTTFVPTVITSGTVTTKETENHTATNSLVTSTTMKLSSFPITLPENTDVTISLPTDADDTALTEDMSSESTDSLTSTYLTTDTQGVDKPETKTTASVQSTITSSTSSTESYKTETSIETSTFGTLTTPKENINYVCENLPFEYFITAHPKSCSLFIACSFGIAIAMSCNDNLWFNNQLLRCVKPELSDCRLIDPSAVQDVTPPDSLNEISNACANKNEIYFSYHPTDCCKFIICVNGMAYGMNYPKGSRFDYLSKECVYSKYIRCLVN